MPGKNTTSPYASSFNSAIKRGTPCWTAVCNIATRCKKTPTMVFNSLCKSGLCFRQKFNGQWVYWACNTPKKFSGKTRNTCQTQMWQWFVEWCIANGHCTPEQMHKHCGTQAQFMSWCKKFWNRQFTASKASKPKSRKSSKPKSRKSAPKARSRKNIPATFKFPTVKSRPAQRRYRKVA